MKKSRRTIIASLILAAVVGISITYYMFNLSHKDLRKTKPDYVITSGDLLKEFENDEKTASEKYINKIIEVTGTVQSVTRSDNKSLNIVLTTGNELSSVICTMQADIDQISGNKGDRMTLRGECSGFLMDVLLNNCSVIER